MQSFPERCGLLVVGHGSREEIGVREFLETVEQLPKLERIELLRKLAGGDVPIEPGFLEFVEPSIAEGFRRLIAQGARHVIVVPAVLFAAGHAKRDIPDAVAAAAAQAPGVTTLQAEHLGSEVRLLHLSEKRCDEALARATRSFDETLLVLVGRGSHDDAATAEMHAFAQAREQLRSLISSRDEIIPPFEVAFLAMAEPRLVDVLERAAAGPPKRIIVQPHLLFGGVLLDRIADMVRQFATRFPQHEWITAGHLGPDAWVGEALLMRAAAMLMSRAT